MAYCVQRNDFCHTLDVIIVPVKQQLTNLALMNPRRNYSGAADNSP